MKNFAVVYLVDITEVGSAGPRGQAPLALGAPRGRGGSGDPSA